MTELIVAVMSTLCLVASLVLRFEPFADIMTKQQRNKVVWSYVGSCLLNVSVLLVIFRNNGISMTTMNVDILFFGITTELLNIFIIKNRTREHLFVFGIVFTCNALLMALPIYVVNQFFDFDLNIERILTTSGFVVLMVATYYPMRILLRETVEPFFSLDSADYWKTVWFIPVGMCMAIYFAFPSGTEDVTGMSIISRGLIGASMVFLSLSVAKDHKQMRAKKHMEELLNDQKLHYARMQEQVEEIRRARHDFKHYIAAVQRYVETDDKEGLRTYCLELEKRYNREISIPYTGNVAADGVLYRYMQLCYEDKVTLKYMGRIKNEGIADMDICVLLGNALDNALEASAKAQKPEIKVVAQSEAHMLSIMVRNTFDGQLKIKNDQLQSRKRENGTGIGLKSMQAVCDKYGGTMEVKWEEHTFTVLFLLPIK